MIDRSYQVTDMSYQVIDMSYLIHSSRKKKKKLKILRGDYKTFFLTHMECQNAMQNNYFQSKKCSSFFILTLNTLGNISSRRHFKIFFFSYFPIKYV